MGGIDSFVGFPGKSESSFCWSGTRLMLCLVSLAAERAAMADANGRGRVLKEQLLDWRCLINAVSFSRWLGWFRKTLSKLAVIRSCSLLVGAMVTLRGVMSRVQHAQRLNCLPLRHFCTSSFATSFRTATVMLMSRDLQIWFSVKPWGILSAFGQVWLVYIAFLQNKSSTLPCIIWTLLVFLISGEKFTRTHTHTCAQPKVIRWKSIFRHVVSLRLRKSVQQI